MLVFSHSPWEEVVTYPVVDPDNHRPEKSVKQATTLPFVLLCSTCMWFRGYHTGYQRTFVLVQSQLIPLGNLEQAGWVKH